VLFDLKGYEKSEELSLILESYEVPEFFCNQINNDGFLFFELDASVGMGGYIIARKFNHLILPI
jgi:hypothetical protein